MAALSLSDVSAVLACLQAVLRPGPDQKAAEAVLTSLEGRPGFCSCLAEVIGSGAAQQGQQQHDHSARWLASVHFKNTVLRHWRTGLGPPEKAHLRGAVLGLIGQEDNQIAIQVAVVLAKMARVDYPAEWPHLFHSLLALLRPAPPEAGSAPLAPPPPASSSSSSSSSRQQQQLTARRVYLVLHHLLKELSSKRLPADQRAFHDVATLLLPFLWAQWGATTQVGVRACVCVCERVRMRPCVHACMRTLSACMPAQLVHAWIALCIGCQVPMPPLPAHLLHLHTSASFAARLHASQSG